MMSIYTMLDYLLISVGLIGLIASFHPTRQMIMKLPPGSTLTLWKVLTGLIIFFVVAYIVILFLLSSLPDSILKNTLVYMLLGGGVFVWIMTRVSVDSIDTLERVAILEKQSTTDSLMRIYNRRYLETRLEQEFSRAKRYKENLVFMMLDIDHFKSVNDQYGHDIGDKVLIELAKLLKATVRKSDVIARYGGEEIAIICPKIEIQGAMILAERLRHTVNENLTISIQDMVIAKKHAISGNLHEITVSIGVSCIDDSFNDYFEFMKHADKALYQAKHDGRNRVEFACKPKQSEPE